MMNESIYLLVSTEKYLLNRRIADLAKEFRVPNLNFIRVDDLENHCDFLIEELQTVSLFSENKMLVIDYDELIKLNENYQKRLAKIIEKKNANNILIICSSTRPLGRGVIETALNNFAYIDEFAQMNEKTRQEIVDSMVSAHEFSIETKAIDELLKRCDNNLDLIEIEIDKITTYLNIAQVITVKNVIDLVSPLLVDHIYDLTAALLGKEKRRAILIYDELIAHNTEPLLIMNNLGIRLVNLLRCQMMNDLKYDQEEIAMQIGISHAQAYYLIRDSKQITYNSISRLLDSIASLDHQIKLGLIDKKIGLQIYLLGV